MPDPSRAVLLDPAAAHPGVADVRAALTARDWPRCRLLLDQATPDERQYLIRIGSDESELEGFLRGVLEADPGDAAAATMLGHHLIGVGWKIRTGARAEHVGAEQFASFHAWLRRAEQVLIDAAARHPAEREVWVARLMSARGLQLGLAETRRRYDRLRALDPHNFQGQTQFLQSMCPKWSGSWELLHAWAREEMVAAPAGSLSGALVAEAHIEHAIELPDGEREAYLADPRVRGELHEAAHHSVWNPRFRRTCLWVQAAGDFAMAFSLVGDQPAAASVFRLLGDLGSRYPWHYLSGETEDAIVRRRTTAYRAVGEVR